MLKQGDIPPRQRVSTPSEWRSRLRLGVFLVCVVLLSGIIGYKIIAHATWLQSVYYTVCVVTTLGPPEQADSAGMTFTILLAIGGVGLFFYAIVALAEFVVAGELQRAIEKRRDLRHMKRLANHFIICGFGRIGSLIAHQLVAQGHACVIIERDEALAESAKTQQGLMALIGDASDELVLEEAGFPRARAVVICTPSDAENVLITMTARQMNASIPIVVRCDNENNAPKFLRAGATRVVTPNMTGATQMLLAATKPHVIDLIDLATGSGKQPFQIREIIVPDSARAAGQSLKQLSLGSRFGVIVLGIKSTGLTMQFNPSADTPIHGGDVLITVGHEDKFQALETFLAN